MHNKLNQLRDLKEMYEARLKSANVDKSLTNHYQTMLDSINKKIEKKQTEAEITADLNKWSRKHFRSF